MSASVDANVLIMAAAPADFRAQSVAGSKIKKASAPESIALASTTDILAASLGHRPSGLITVGFALETDALIENARAKLEAKQLDLVVANRAGIDGEGFGSDTNRVTFIAKDDAQELPIMSKDAVAERLLDRVEEMIRGR